MRRRRWFKSERSRTFERAAMLSELRRWRDAISMLERLVAEDPSDDESWCLLSDCFYEAGLMARALLAAESGVAVAPESTWAHQVRSRALAGVGRRDEAVAAAQRAVQLDPTWLRALADLAWVLGNAGRREEALAAGDEAVRLAPDDAEAWFAKSWAAQALPDWAEAEKALRRAVELQPDYSMWHNNVGYVVLQQGRFAEAVEWLREALRLDPMNKRALGNLGAALRWQGELDEGTMLRREVVELALQAATEAVRENPRDADAHWLRGQYLIQLARLDEAEAAVRRSIELDPEKPLPWLQLSELLVRRGREPEAREAVERGASLDPEGVMTQCCQARVAAIIGDPELAPRAIADVLDRHPHAKDVWEGIAYAAAAEGKWAEAEHWFAKRVESDRLDCCSAVWLGLALQHRGASNEAEACLEHAVKANPLCPDLRRLRQPGPDLELAPEPVVEPS